MRVINNNNDSYRDKGYSEKFKCYSSVNQHDCDFKWYTSGTIILGLPTMIETQYGSTGEKTKTFIIFDSKEDVVKHFGINATKDIEIL